MRSTGSLLFKHGGVSEDSFTLHHYDESVSLVVGLLPDLGP